MSGQSLPLRQNSTAPGRWMRAHYSFVGLRNLIMALKDHPQGLRATELNRIVYHKGLIRTKKGTPPSVTSLYHFRSALLKLGIIERRNRKLVIAHHDPLVAELLNASTSEPHLTPSERRIFASIVLRNSDCRKNFFDFFMPSDGEYGPAEFVAGGEPVIWQESPVRKGRGIRFLRNSGETAREISEETEIQAILYGLRYWARDELALVDELFREDLGNLMFPIKEPHSVPERSIRNVILCEISNEEEWTILSVRDLVAKWAVKLKVPVVEVFNSISRLYRAYPGYVTLIPTSRNLATITTASWLREELELRSYLKDELGRYISHIRLHRHLKEEIRD